MSCHYDKVVSEEGILITHKSKQPTDDRLLHSTVTYKVSSYLSLRKLTLLKVQCRCDKGTLNSNCNFAGFTVPTCIQSTSQLKMPVRMKKTRVPDPKPGLKIGQLREM